MVDVEQYDVIAIPGGSRRVEPAEEVAEPEMAARLLSETFTQRYQPGLVPFDHRGEGVDDID